MERKNEENVVYPITFAKEFPETPSPEVDRSQLIQTLDRLFVDTSVVFLDSSEGCGATTVCAQFCHAHRETAISLFIKPASRIAYSADYLRLVLAEQFHWIIDGTRFSKDIVSPEEFNILRLKLRGRASKARPIYIVVDGLHQIPKDDERAVETIMREILPIGWDHFYFLVVGDEKKLAQYLHGLHAKPYYLTSFAFPETKNFFELEQLDDDQLRAIHGLCNGLPGKMASVRRLLRAGTTVDDLLTSDPSKALEFVKLEFAVLDNLPDTQLRLLSIITFSSRYISKDELMEIAAAFPSDLEALLRGCTFLSANAADVIEFVSDSHRRYAARRLETRRNDALKAQIDYLLKKPGGIIALRFLPTYYQQLGQLTELIHLLTSDHFSSLLRSTASIGSLRTRAELGLASALQANRLSEMFGFAVKRSLFSTIAQAFGLRSEVRALVATGQTSLALSLANRSTVKEERLGFLCSFAKQCRDSKIEINQDLLSTIQEESKSVDFAEMGEAAVDLAADLVEVDPDLALSIVEKATQGRRESPLPERTFAKVEISDRRSQESNDSLSSNAHDRALQKVTEKFASAIMGVLVDMSLDQVIARVGNFEERHRVPFLCSWIRMHRTDPQAINVAEHALDAMIDATTYAPKMSDLCDLAVTLPFAGDKKFMISMIARFDSQRGLIRETAVSSRSVQLQMTLAHAEHAGQTGKCAERILDAYYEVAALQNSDTKLDCLAVMLSALRRIDTDGSLEAEHGFREIIRGDLRQILTTVLAETADQVHIVRRALEALTVADFDAAMEICHSLNTQSRRDEAFVEMLHSLYDDGINESVLSGAATVVGEIRNRQVRESEISRLLSTLHSRKTTVSREGCETLKQIVDTLQIYEEKAPAAIFLAGIAQRSGHEDMATELLANIDSAVEHCAGTIYRADMYFTAAWVTAEQRPEQAKELYDAGRRCIATGSLPEIAHIQAVVSCLTLAVRALGWLVKVATLDDDTVARFTRLVELIPIPDIRIDIYSDLACRAWLADRRDFARSLVISKCVPLVEQALRESTARADRLIERAFPAMFLSIHRETAFDYLERLETDARDLAICRTIYVMLNRRTWTDPRYEDKKERFSIKPEDGLDVCSLIENLCSDDSIFFAASDLCQSIIHKNNRTSFTAQQKERIGSRLKAVFADKLPDANNIRHEGYLILATACELSLREVGYDPWVSLVNRGGALTNTADKAYVLHELAERLPKKYTQLITEVRTEAFAIADRIPSAIDRISRIIKFTSDVGPDGVAHAKAALRSAMLATFIADDQDLARQRRREIIDVAAKYGEDFAEELSDLLDEDPARVHARAEVRSQLKEMKVARTLADSVEDAHELKTEDESHLGEAAWTALNRLMSGRLESKSPTALSGFLRQGSNRPIESAFPVLSWHIENVAMKYVTSRAAEDRIRPIVEQLLTSAELAVSLVGAVAQRKQDEWIASGYNDSQGILGIANRAEALQFIENWLSECNEEIILCDPYFGPEDISFLTLILANCPACELTILTSKKELIKKDALGDERFTEAWQEIRDQKPPKTRFVAISHAESGKTPLHDRWLVSGQRGLRLGTSINSIGTGKLSEISVLRPNESEKIVSELRRFSREESPIEGLKISYLSFRLSDG